MLRKLLDCVCSYFSKFEIRRKHVILGDNSTLSGVCKFLSDTPGSILIGANTTINSGRRFNPIGGDTYAMLRTIGTGRIVIGSNVGISNSTIVSRTEIIIEDDVRIGGSCKLYDNDFHSLDLEKRISAHDDDIRSAPIRIKKGAFIGAHCIILKGVTIGEGAVIGAGSVCTKNVPAGEIWAGNPAKRIRERAN